MKTRTAVGVLPFVLAAAWLLLGQYTRAASLIVLGAGVEGPARTLARLHERPVAERDLEVAARSGRLRARAYVPGGAVRRTVVLVTGVHPAGIDEPRLRHFARSLAAVGLLVVTPELPRLFAFEITPDATDAIEDVALWTARHPDLAADGLVGLAGISFSGGLALVAAGRPAIRDRVAFVLSIGGHGDLPRTLDALSGGALSGAAAAADPFALAMVLTAAAHRVVPPDQVALLRDWGRTYLEAAHLPIEARDERQRLFARADRLAAALPEPAATLARYARTGDGAALRPYVLEIVRELAADAALSPERAPPPAAPVFLLHGTDDPVIPPEESRRLAARLDAHTRVRLVVTPVLSHADVTAVLTARRAWELVGFFASVLRR